MICLSQTSYLLNSLSDSTEEVGPQSAFWETYQPLCIFSYRKDGDNCIFFHTPTYKIQMNLDKSSKRNIPYLKESCHLCA